VSDLDRFETVLLDRLREVVAEQATTSGPARRPRRRRRVLLVAAAATALGVVLLPGLVADPAYSVQEGNDGRIEVTVHRMDDGDGLEALLREHGVASDVTFLPPGYECAPGRYPPTSRRGQMLSVGTDRFTVTLAPGTVRAGEIFVVSASVSRTRTGVGAIVEFDVTPGPVRPCRPRPAANP
jgi:hypothetical protein